MFNNGSHRLSVREFQLPGHRTSYTKGTSAVCGPDIAWNDNPMTTAQTTKASTTERYITTFHRSTKSNNSVGFSTLYNYVP